MRRYRLLMEVYEDDQLIRRMEEYRDKLDNDHADGEFTVGLLLSFVPQWSAVGGDGLATLGAMCHFLPAAANDDVQKFKTLGEAYQKWGASHNFASCVDVRVDRDRLECEAMDCKHKADDELGSL